MNTKRIVITGMGIISPVGDTTKDFYSNLINGKSGIKKLKSIDTSMIDSKIGGDLGDYDYKAKTAEYKGIIPDPMYKKLRKLSRTAPFSTRLTMIAALDAYLNAGLLDSSIDKHDMCMILGGHNFHNKYIEKNVIQFLDEPEYIDGLFGISMFDQDVAACISELLQIYGPMYTIGGACASAGLALRNAVNEIRFNDYKLAMIGGGVLEFSRVGYQAMSMIQAVSYRSFNEDPERASRPFDIRREGFVPSHGTGMLVIEDLEHALERGAPIYAEILGVEANNDGTHLSRPSVEGQSFAINRVIKNAGIHPEQIDYVNAHATSTPVGDLIEIQSLKNVFGKHADKLYINATKSMIGHTGWSSHSIELIASILQMNHGRLHPTINVDELEPEIDLNVLANQGERAEINYFLNNSFGIGGINCCSLVGKYRA